MQKWWKSRCVDRTKEKRLTDQPTAQKKWQKKMKKKEKQHKYKYEFRQISINFSFNPIYGKKCSKMVQNDIMRCLPCFFLSLLCINRQKKGERRQNENNEWVIIYTNPFKWSAKAYKILKEEIIWFSND